MLAIVVVALALVAVYFGFKWTGERGRANRLQARVNEQHEHLGHQSDLWNADRDRLRMLRGAVREILPPEDLDRIRQTEYGRQMLGS